MKSNLCSVYPLTFPPIGVLVEPDSLRGDTASSREERARLAAEARSCTRSAGFKYRQGSGAGGIGYEEEVSPTCTVDWHNPAILTEPIAMADLNANTAIDENMCGTLHVGGDAPTVCV